MYTAAVLLTAPAAALPDTMSDPKPAAKPAEPTIPPASAALAGPVEPILLYHPDAYEVAREDLKGRHSAGESFLSAFLATVRQSEALAIAGRDEHFKAFEKTVKDAKRPLLNARRVARQDIKTLRERGVVHLPVPALGEEARLRAFLGDDTYAISGVAHTIASRVVLEAVAQFATAPVQPWDALICPSTAVHAALSSILANTEEQLRTRLGARTFIRPLMPIIPLGIHARRFARIEPARMRWRTKLGIDEDATVVLFFGRLSVHAKASPFQLAQALEIAAQKGAKLEMVWCGYFADDFQQKSFMTTAKAMAPSVRFHHVDGRKADARFSIWSAADIFCSLSDNIQESFGLTIIEAMAAELPVIAANWDGYRDAIEHGVSGVLVDSYMPAVSLADVAFRHLSGADSYDSYIAAVSQFCLVNVEQTAHWIATLAADPALRRKLGARGAPLRDEKLRLGGGAAAHAEPVGRTARAAQQDARGGPASVDRVAQLRPRAHLCGVSVTPRARRHAAGARPAFRIVGRAGEDARHRGEPARAGAGQRLCRAARGLRGRSAAHARRGRQDVRRADPAARAPRAALADQDRPVAFRGLNGVALKQRRRAAHRQRGDRKPS